MGQAPNWIFFLEMLCFLVFFVLFSCFKMFQKKLEIGKGGGWLWSDQSEFFSDFLIFF